ncbi:unnamed protein product [Caretta caretta]
MPHDCGSKTGADINIPVDGSNNESQEEDNDANAANASSSVSECAPATGSSADGGEIVAREGEPAEGTPLPGEDTEGLLAKEQPVGSRSEAAKESEEDGELHVAGVEIRLEEAGSEEDRQNSPPATAGSFEESTRLPAEERPVSQGGTKALAREEVAAAAERHSGPDNGKDTAEKEREVSEASQRNTPPLQASGELLPQGDGRSTEPVLSEPEILEEEGTQQEEGSKEDESRIPHASQGAKSHVQGGDHANEQDKEVSGSETSHVSGDPLGGNGLAAKEKEPDSGNRTGDSPEGETATGGQPAEKDREEPGTALAEGVGENPNLEAEESEESSEEEDDDQAESEEEGDDSSEEEGDDSAEEEGAGLAEEEGGDDGEGAGPAEAEGAGPAEEEGGDDGEGAGPAEAEGLARMKKRVVIRQRKRVVMKERGLSRQRLLAQQRKSVVIWQRQRKKGLTQQRKMVIQQRKRGLAWHSQRKRLKKSLPQMPERLLVTWKTMAMSKRNRSVKQKLSLILQARRMHPAETWSRTKITLTIVAQL